MFDPNGYGLAHYAANAQLLGVNSSLAASDVTDGLSNTIGVGEINRAFRPWGDPFNFRDPAAGINAGPGSFGGPTVSGGAQFLMLDGSVWFLGQDTDPSVLRALGMPAGADNR